MGGTFWTPASKYPVGHVAVEKRLRTDSMSFFCDCFHPISLRILYYARCILVRCPWRIHESTTDHSATRAKDEAEKHASRLLEDTQSGHRVTIVKEMQ